MKAWGSNKRKGGRRTRGNRDRRRKKMRRIQETNKSLLISSPTRQKRVSFYGKEKIMSDCLEDNKGVLTSP
jgi:type III secretory pathway lipoprotein EscJ